MADEVFRQALSVLKEDFKKIEWKTAPIKVGNAVELMYLWPESEPGDVVVNVHQSKGRREPFHHHEYFYFNYTYQGTYESISGHDGTCIALGEGQLFAGQPFAPHALCVHDDADVTMIGVLIRREALFRTYLPRALGNQDFFRFLVSPQTNNFSDEFIRLSFAQDSAILRILKLMVIEYAFKRSDTPFVLESLTHVFLAYVGRQLALERGRCEDDGVVGAILRYISENITTVSLEDVARRFAYHPNYVSSLLAKHLGTGFSHIVQQQRMERASLMLQGTDLAVEEIAAALGYASKSSFYKAFKGYFGRTPGEMREEYAAQA